MVGECFADDVVELDDSRVQEHNTLRSSPRPPRDCFASIRLVIRLCKHPSSNLAYPRRSAACILPFTDDTSGLLHHRGSHPGCSPIGIIALPPLAPPLPLPHDTPPALRSTHTSVPTPPPPSLAHPLIISIELIRVYESSTHFSPPQLLPLSPRSVIVSRPTMYPLNRFSLSLPTRQDTPPHTANSVASQLHSTQLI